MSKDQATDRAALLRAATLVRPALADKSIIPALTHIAVDGMAVTAYDDKMAIMVRCDSELTCLVPGVLFIQALNSFGGKEVIVGAGEGQNITLKSGRGRVKLPTLPLEDFPLKWPRESDESINIEGDMLKSIERCLISVNTDATQPAQMGITMDVDDQGHAVFFSTDNNSVSRAQCSTKIKLPGDVPVIMPRPFCEQLLALSKAYPDTIINMDLGDGFLDVAFLIPGADVEARLFSRTLVDLDPLPFPKIMARHCGDISTLKKRTAVVPDELDAALSRALLVLNSEQKKRVQASVWKDELSLHATSEFGDSDDSMKIDLDDVGPVSMDAAFVARGLKHASRITINDRVTILVGGENCEFVHMVSHVRDTQ